MLMIVIMVILKSMRCWIKMKPNLVTHAELEVALNNFLNTKIQSIKDLIILNFKEAMREQGIALEKQMDKKLEEMKKDGITRD